MNKTFKVFKAMLSQDMQFFRYKNKQNSSKLKKISLPLILFTMVALSIGMYAYELAEPLSKVNLTYIMLTIFLMFTIIISFIQGIYKSQGILFEGKDDNLLFSLPINKSIIFFLRVMKLLIYQIIYNLMFILPAFVVYIILEKPSIIFYLISLLMMILLPIIPTLIATILGYFVKGLSSKSKFKKLAQSLLTTLVFLVIWVCLMKFQDFSKDIVKNATSINDIINKVCYPIGLYINLITKFNLLDLIKLLLINIIPFVIVVKLGSIFYFNIISSSKETATKTKKTNNKINYKKQNKIISLAKKDLVKYITSPVYVMNTMFSLLVILISTIVFCINPNKVFDLIIQGNAEITFDSIVKYLPYVYGILVIFASVTTSITSSSISIEGKTFEITKSLPIKEENIFLSKILFGNLVSIPIILLSTIIFIVKFKVSILNSIVLILLSIVSPTLSSLFGLLANLLFPKMNASSDTEVVKQSMSAMIGVWGGMIIAGLSGYFIIRFIDSKFVFEIMSLELIVIILIDLILWIILKTYGKKLYNTISI